MLPHPGRRVCRASSLSAGYAVLYPSAAPGEGRLDPARGSWAVFMQMAAERALIPWSQPSFIPRDTRALTVKPHLLFLPGSYPIHPIFHILYILYTLFFLEGTMDQIFFLLSRTPNLLLAFLKIKHRKDECKRKRIPGSENKPGFMKTQVCKQSSSEPAKECL